jgi:hypothetical protein
MVPEYQPRYAKHLRADFVIIDRPETVEAKSFLVAKWY